MLTLEKRFLKSMSLVIILTVIYVWGLALIPFRLIPVSPLWLAIIERSFSTLLSILLISIFYPNSLNVIRLSRKLQPNLVSLLIVFLLVGPSILTIKFGNFAALEIIQRLIFAFFIGLEEEFFSRGLIFSVLKSNGLGVAFSISSFHFGLLHLGNLVWGHQSFIFTVAQVITASAFGFLEAALMTYTGSIWIPVLLHGLNDFPMQFESQALFNRVTASAPDWIGVGIDVLIYLSIAFCLLLLHDSNKRCQIRSFLMRAQILKN